MIGMGNKYGMMLFDAPDITRTLDEEASVIANFFVALQPDLRDKVIELVQDRMCISCGTEYDKCEPGHGIECWCMSYD